jgi:CspA family cold shock protein
MTLAFGCVLLGRDSFWLVHVRVGFISHRFSHLYAFRMNIIDGKDRRPQSFFTSIPEEDVRRDRESRRPQRRGFDDDNFAPPPRFGYSQREGSPRFEPAATGPTVSATVKWYNPEKGFGFVQLPSGGDAHLHVSVVERSGNSTVPPGATLEVRTAPGQKGLQITEILSVDASTAQPEQPRRPRPERSYQSADQTAVEEIGTVKWYHPDKGFGFIVRDRGGKDIFLHVSALNRAGLSDLVEEPIRQPSMATDHFRVRQRSA